MSTPVTLESLLDEIDAARSRWVVARDVDGEYRYNGQMRGTYARSAVLAWPAVAAGFERAFAHVPGLVTEQLEPTRELRALLAAVRSSGARRAPRTGSPDSDLARAALVAGTLADALTSLPDVTHLDSIGTAHLRARLAASVGDIARVSLAAVEPRGKDTVTSRDWWVEQLAAIDVAAGQVVRQAHPATPSLISDLAVASQPGTVASTLATFARVAATHATPGILAACPATGLEIALAARRLAKASEAVAERAVLPEAATIRVSALAWDRFADAWPRWVRAGHGIDPEVASACAAVTQVSDRLASVSVPPAVAVTLARRSTVTLDQVALTLDASTTSVARAGAFYGPARAVGRLPNTTGRELRARLRGGAVTIPPDHPIATRLITSSGQARSAARRASLAVRDRPVVQPHGTTESPTMRPG